MSDSNWPGFFKVFLPKFSSERLTIPIGFVQFMKGRTSGTVRLTGPSGNIWKVQMIEEEDGFSLEEGWPEFLNDHLIVIGEFLHFRYDGDLSFAVAIYDHSACEKESAFRAKPSQPKVKASASSYSLIKSHRESQGTKQKTDQSQTYPDFFKVFMPETSSEKLTIPIGFVHFMEGRTSGTVRLTGPSGNIWQVQMIEEEDGFSFEEGWPEFLNDHLIVIGEFLHFRYDGDLSFTVAIYDHSACEKESAFRAKPSQPKVKASASSYSLIKLHRESQGTKQKTDQSQTYPDFFKVFMPDTSSEKLTIPIGFVQFMEGRTSGTVRLTGPSGNIWQVQMIEEEDGFSFEEGWPEFLNDHLIVIGEFLHFRYDGNLSFTVAIYDHSACEKESAFRAKPSQPKVKAFASSYSLIKARRESQGTKQKMDQSQTCPDFFEVFFPESSSVKLEEEEANEQYCYIEDEEGKEDPKPENLELRKKADDANTNNNDNGHKEDEDDEPKPRAIGYC